GVRLHSARSALGCRLAFFGKVVAVRPVSAWTAPVPRWPCSAAGLSLEASRAAVASAAGHARHRDRRRTGGRYPHKPGGLADTACRTAEAGGVTGRAAGPTGPGDDP